MSHLQIISYSLLLIVLILLAAFFSCAETALMAVNRYRLRHQAGMKKRYAMRLLQLLKRPDRVLGAILIGSTFANMVASSLATLLAYHFLGGDGALLAAMGLTVLMLIFAEITPKTLAALYPDQIAKWMSYPIQLILTGLYPAVWLANSVANGLLRLLRVHVTNAENEPLSREELRSIVYDTAGKISRQYKNMLLSILDLNKLTVNDVMVPRDEMIGIDMAQSLEKMIAQIQHFPQDFAPVYQEHVNQIVGVLYTRDVLKLLLTKTPITKELLQQFLQEPYFVPEGTSLSIQLGHFQHSHDKMAFIVDEYGVVQGLLTLNDILEEIVGDFTTGASLGKHLQPQPDGSMLVDGAMTVREFNRSTQWELPLRGPRTINGLIVEYLESLPHAGTAVLIANYPIEIITVKENRVKLARVYPKL